VSAKLRKPPAIVEFAVSAAMVERFAALTGDRSSLHTDEAFARRSIYRRPVVHGMLPVSYLLLAETMSPPGHVARIDKLAAKFIAPAFVGDELALAVEQAPDPEARQDAKTYAFRVERRPTGEELTRGSVTVRHVARARSADGGVLARRGPPGAVAAVGMRSLAIADLAKGHTDGFEFAVTNDLTQAFSALLAQGLRTSSSGEPALDAAQMLAFALFSTLVGMRLPGETATFLELEADAEPIELGREYRLEGRVAHASRSTSIVKVDVAIAPTDAPGAGAVRGRIAALVNKPARRSRSMAELRRTTDLGLRDKVALITGASRGIGETTAKLFALLGAKVVLNYRRSKSEAERIADEIAAAGGSALAVQADVSDREQVAAMVDMAVARFGGIDVLVNNAVRDFRSIAFAALDWTEIQADLDVTLKGAFWCSKLVAPHMLARGGGKIVNISSIYADDPPPDQLKYVVSKAALEGLARALAAEFAGKNIQVNTVVPAFVDTEIASQMHDAVKSFKARESPMKRNASPEDVAHAVLFLASSFSSYTTGQRILVTGGAPFL
jgi:3-oxoacyl-[acyl-carrier protein] reductase